MTTPTVYVCRNWHAGTRPDCGVCGEQRLSEWDQATVEADLRGAVSVVARELAELDPSRDEDIYDVARELGCNVDGDPRDGNGSAVYLIFSAPGPCGDDSDGWGLYGWVEATDPDTGEQVALAETQVES